LPTRDKRKRRGAAVATAATVAALPASRFDRLLAAAAPDVADADAKLAPLRSFLLLHGAVRSWLWLSLDTGSAAHLDPPLLIATATLLSVAFALSFAPRLAPLASRLALPALVAQLIMTFPTTDNHFFVELLAVSLLALPGAPSSSDDALVLRALLWMTALILFHTGLQKILYGHYFRGDFLAFMVGRGDRFAAALTAILPADEITRLQSYDPLRTGAGPYRVASPLLTAASNFVYLAELVLPALFFFPSTRRAAAWCAIALVTVIQLGAREIGFWLLFSNLLLLFLPGAWNQRLLPALIALYGWALAAGFGVLPGGDLINPTHL